MIRPIKMVTLAAVVLLAACSEGGNDQPYLELTAST
jgi:hypothetical protein